MKNKIILLILMFILLPCLVEAISFEKDSLVDLKLPCSFNGTFCDTSAICNSTIIYPNGSIMLDNQKMTNTGNGRPNVTLTDSSILGEYKFTYTCKQSGFADTGSGTFLITNSGQDRLNEGEGISIIGSIIVMIISAGLLFLISFKSDNLAWKIIFIGLSCILIVATILFSLVILNESVGNFTNIIEGYSTFWMVIKVIVSAGILFLVLFSLLLAWRLWQYKRGFLD